MSLSELLLYEGRLKLSPSPELLEFLLGMSLGFIIGNATARAMLMKLAGITAEEIKRRIRERLRERR